MYGFEVSVQRACLVWLMCMALLVSSSATGAPLRQSGDDSAGDTYERVFTRPGAILYETAAGQQSVAGEAESPFQVFYVHERKGGFVRVGPNAGDKSTGWIAENSVVNWRSHVVVTFNKKSTRSRTLFFDSEAALRRFLDDPEMETLAEQYSEYVERNEIPPGSGLIAAEPPEFISWRENFYLMPILNRPLNEDTLMHDDLFPRGFRVLETAAVPKTQSEDHRSCRADPEVAVVFVIDTTLSMEPYIRSTQRTIESMSDALRQADGMAAARFGLIGFRDDTNAAPGLGYRVKEYYPLQNSSDSRALASAIRNMNATTVSSQGFREDALAGVMKALDSDWRDTAHRWIVLVTDASLREPGDELSGTGLSPGVVNMLAQEDHQVSVLALHLKTPAGKANSDHARAREQLRGLVRQADAGSGYFGIDDGDVAAFAEQSELAVERIVAQSEIPLDELRSSAETGDVFAQIGLGQRLAWLGRCNQANAPDIIRGWTVDAAIGSSSGQRNPERALEPRILLTRAQLSRLFSALSLILEARFDQETTAGEFYDRVITVLRDAALDANRIPTLDNGTSADFTELADSMTRLGDLLPSEVLPYASAMLTMTRDEWTSSITPQDRDAWISSIRYKLDWYQIYYSDQENWIRPHPDAKTSELVYPMRLDQLP